MGIVIIGAGAVGGQPRRLQIAQQFQIAAGDETRRGLALDPMHLIAAGLSGQTAVLEQGGFQNSDVDLAPFGTQHIDQPIPH